MGGCAGAVEARCGRCRAELPELGQSRAREFGTERYARLRASGQDGIAGPSHRGMSDCRHAHLFKPGLHSWVCQVSPSVPFQLSRVTRYLVTVGPKHRAARGPGSLPIAARGPAGRCVLWSDIPPLPRAAKGEGRPGAGARQSGCMRMVRGAAEIGKPGSLPPAARGL